MKTPQISSSAVLALAFVASFADPTSAQDGAENAAKATTEAAEALAPLHAAYHTARAARFAPGPDLEKLREACAEFIMEWEGRAKPAIMATARTYRIRCLLTDEAVEEVAREAQAVLRTKGISDIDSARLHYYRGIAAVHLEEQEVAEECLAELTPLNPDVALALRSQVREMWPLIDFDERPPQWTLAQVNADAEDGTKGTLQLQELRGKYVLLDFWATWCGPCLALMASELKPLHDQWADDDRFVLVSIGTSWRGDTALEQAELARSKDYGWTKVFDRTGEVTVDYGVRGIPALFFLDPEGDVLAYGSSAEVLTAVKFTLAKLPQERAADGDEKTPAPEK